jgi:hypothetical protein
MYGRGIFVKKNGLWVETTPRVADHNNPLASNTGNTVVVSVTVIGGSGGSGGGNGYPGYNGRQVTGNLTLGYSDQITIAIGAGGGAGSGGAGAGGGGGGANNLGFNGANGGSAGSGGGNSGGGGGGATVLLLNKQLKIVAGGGGGGGGGGASSDGRANQGYTSDGHQYGLPGQDKTSGGNQYVGGGGGGKIICTKLYQLGLLPKDIYAADQAFGARLVERYPDVYNGYRAWAEIVVDWMSGDGPQMMFWIRDTKQRQQAQINWATRWAQAIATPWANWMANRNSRTGFALMVVGTPISYAVGVWRRVFGASKKPAGFVKGLALIGVFTLLRTVVAIGKLLGK